MKKPIYLSLLTILFIMVCNKNVVAQEDTIYDFKTMEHPPTFPGGTAKFSEMISRKLSYPEQAVRDRIEAIVQVSFIVEKDGTLTDINVSQKKGYGLDQEAMRFIKSTKKWNPGTVNDQPVRSRYIIPIVFSLR